MAKSKYSDKQKLKALGLMSQEKPLREISEQLNVSYAVLLRWRTELEEAQETSKVEELVNIDQLIVHKIAEETIRELNSFKRESQITDILQRPEDRPLEGVVETQVMELVQGIDGYQQLNTRLQEVAFNLASKIDAIANTTSGPAELGMLVDNLATLQTAFFNKNVTNVNVLNATTAQGGNTFGGFKNRD